jgi:glyoxylase-like metal-dependent hydrolase (beta-lactamase superfamily II)/rhodanese-related sulfurtransferase
MMCETRAFPMVLAQPLSPALLAAAAGGGPLLFRQLFDADTGTFSYLLADVESGEAVLIDSVYEQHSRDLSLIRELGLDLVASLDTHAHADHVTGSWLLHQATACAIGLAAAAGAQNVTLPLAHGDRIRFGRRHLDVRSTPGHTNGCLTFVLDDHTMAFTGDALLVRGCGRCDFQQGNPQALYRSITGQILSLPDGCLLYPGHDYNGRQVTSVAEEKAFNARLGGDADEGDFVGHVRQMRLPHPHRITEAVSGNLRSGRPTQPAPSGDWAPVVPSFAGLPQLAPAWVQAHRDELTLVDVRAAEEFDGPDGHIPGSLSIPLTDLERRQAEIPMDRPLLMVCRSGSRSALATQQLLQAGRPMVANLQGGLIRWQGEGLPLQL